MYTQYFGLLNRCELRPHSFRTSIDPTLTACIHGWMCLSGWLDGRTAECANTSIIVKCMVAPQVALIQFQLSFVRMFMHAQNALQGALIIYLANE